MISPDPQSFVPLQVVALRLGVPFSWLRSEVEAGRIPCIRAGGRRLFDVAAVRNELLQRSTGVPSGK